MWRTVLCHTSPPLKTAIPRRAAQVLGRIRGFGDAAQDPREFTTAPTLAIPKALGHAGLSMRDVDYWEINEAFSVVDLVNRQLMQLDPERWVSVPFGVGGLGGWMSLEV